LHLALLENKYDIVSFLLQHDINLEKFLEYERLKQFYNNEIVSSISLPLEWPLLHVHSTKSTTKLLNFLIKLYNFNLCLNCKELNIMVQNELLYIIRTWLIFNITYIFQILYYSFLKYQKAKKTTEPFILFLQNKRKKIITDLDEQDIQIFNNELLINKNFEFWSPHNDPEMNLFFWCVFSKRFEIAKLLWKMGKVKLFFHNQ
jgi:hypothetical protein